MRSLMASQKCKNEFWKERQSSSILEHQSIAQVKIHGLRDHRHSKREKRQKDEAYEDDSKSFTVQIFDRAVIFSALSDWQCYFNLAVFISTHSYSNNPPRYHSNFLFGKNICQHRLRRMCEMHLIEVRRLHFFLIIRISWANSPLECER